MQVGFSEKLYSFADIDVGVFTRGLIGLKFYQSSHSLPHMVRVPAEPWWASAHVQDYVPISMAQLVYVDAARICVQPQRGYMNAAGARISKQPQCGYVGHMGICKQLQCGYMDHMRICKQPQCGYTDL